MPSHPLLLTSYIYHNLAAAIRESPHKVCPVCQVLMESRKRKASGLVLAMFSLSLIIVTLGVYSATRTENVSIAVTCVGSYLCIFFGVLGLFLRENRKQLVSARSRTDMRPLKAGRCKFYTCGNDYIYENYYIPRWFPCHRQVPYQGLMESCHMSVRSGTCHCCDQYNCANGGYLNHHYQFVGVQSCQDVLLLYRAMWILIVLYLVAFGLGVFTAAVLGGIKDQVKEASHLMRFRRGWNISCVVTHDVDQAGNMSLMMWIRQGI
uniref:Si:dkey-283j8.1 n=1 Tax=Paramormyrops kingsleyae TaxID=1676925 RepID=A0A3B3SZW7_9TELE